MRSLLEIRNTLASAVVGPRRPIPLPRDDAQVLWEHLVSLNLDPLLDDDREALKCSTCGHPGMDHAGTRGKPLRDCAPINGRECSSHCQVFTWTPEENAPPPPTMPADVGTVWLTPNGDVYRLRYYTTDWAALGEPDLASAKPMYDLSRNGGGHSTTKDLPEDAYRVWEPGT